MRYPPRSSYFLLLYIILSHFNQAEAYELGQGLQSGNFYLSGYTNLELINRFDIPKSFELDDLSLFAGARINQSFNPFAEVELSKYVLIRENGGTTHGDVIVERFYNDALLSDHDTIRVGKMLTPLGNWNLIHAAPLIPIITRPYTTAQGFDAYTSGVTWLHDSYDGETPDVQIYWEPGKELFKRPITQATRNFDNVTGAHLNKPFGLLDRLGASYQHGVLVETGETYSLFGLNANKSFGKFRFESEAITSRFTGPVLSGAPPRLHEHEFGMFILTDYSITPKWHGILEGEYYQDHMVTMSSRSTLIAIAYKPSAPIVWKMEYIHQAGVSSSIATIRTGLKASLAILF